MAKTTDRDNSQILSGDLSWDDHTRMFTACASDVGWRAGFWPKTVNILYPETGNLVELVYHSIERAVNGEFMKMRWRNDFHNVSLQLYND